MVRISAVSDDTELTQDDVMDGISEKTGISAPSTAFCSSDDSCCHVLLWEVQRLQRLMPCPFLKDCAPLSRLSDSPSRLVWSAQIQWVVACRDVWCVDCVWVGSGPEAVTEGPNCAAAANIRSAIQLSL